MVDRIGSQSPDPTQSAGPQPMPAGQKSKNPEVSQGFPTANSFSFTGFRPASFTPRIVIPLDTPSTTPDATTTEDQELVNELTRQSVNMKIDSFRASVSHFNKTFKARDVDISDGYTLMSMITGMLGDTLALIGAELIGNDFLNKNLDKNVQSGDEKE